MRLPKLYTKWTVTQYVALSCLVIVGMTLPFFSTNAGIVDEVIAGSKDVVLYVSSSLLYLVGIWAMGYLATLAIGILVYLAQLNHFTDLSIIVEAWSVVRDLSNMVFIVVLLAIAFGTLFRLESYSWKKLLPKMIIAAILINYSRAICGVFVDASQIVMLTFVAAIKDAATVGFVEAFNLGKLLQFGNTYAQSDPGSNPTNSTKTSSSEGRYVAMLVAAGMLATLFSVIFVYCIVLVGRLVIIWFLTVLSPLRFATSILPATEKFANQWDELFGRYVTIGPMIMFFLWLSLFIAARSVDLGGLGSVSASQALQINAEVADRNSSHAGASALDTSLIAGFIIATMMLSIGMKLALDNSSELGEYTGKAKDFGKWMTRLAPAAAAGFVGGAFAGMAADRIFKYSGVDLNLRRGLERVRHKRHELQVQRVQEGEAKAMTGAAEGKILPSLLGAQDFAYEQYMPILGENGLIGGNKSLLGRNLFGDKAYKESLAASMRAEDVLRQSEEEKYKAIKAAQAKYTSVGNQKTSLASLNQARTEVNSAQADGSGWNLANTEVRRIVEDLKKATIAERDQAARDGKPTQVLDEEIKSLDAALKSAQQKDKSGKLINPSGDPINIVGDLGVKLSAGKQAAFSQLDDREKAERAKLTKDSNGKVIANAEDLVNAVKLATAQQTKQVEDAKAALTKANKKTAHFGPVFDYERVTKMEKVLAEERKKYGREDNEDTLRARLGDVVHEKKGTEILGLMTHMAEVGHVNEMAGVFAEFAHGAGIKPGDNNIESLHKMADWIVKETGVDEQMVMAAMNSVSLSAKRVNHQFMAEAVTTKNGRYVWRDESERQLRNKLESDKAAGRILKDGNRLTYGGYKDDGKGNSVWVPEPGMMEFLVETLPASRDRAIKGNMNVSAGQHIFANDAQENQFKELIKQMHGNDPEKLREAMETMEIWKKSIRSNPEEGVQTVIAEIKDTLDKNEKAILAGGKK